MYPHERSLVKRLADKPFALLGVNVGDSEVLLHNLQKEGEITWRYWVDKGSKISGSWGVEGYPMIFVLDQHGVVRFKYEGNPGSAEIDKAIEHLLKELTNETKS